MPVPALPVIKTFLLVFSSKSSALSNSALISMVGGVVGCIYLIIACGLGEHKYHAYVKIMQG